MLVRSHIVSYNNSFSFAKTLNCSACVQVLFFQCLSSHLTAVVAGYYCSVSLFSLIYISLICLQRYHGQNQEKQKPSLWDGCRPEQGPQDNQNCLGKDQDHRQENQSQTFQAQGGKHQLISQLNNTLNVWTSCLQANCIKLTLFLLNFSVRLSTTNSAVSSLGKSVDTLDMRSALWNCWRCLRISEPLNSWRGG